MLNKTEKHDYDYDGTYQSFASFLHNVLLGANPQRPQAALSIVAKVNGRAI